MIDKQIIDRINVKECKYYCNGKCERYEEFVEADYADYSVKCICEKENDLGTYDICDYQQLKRKEQECERLTQGYAELTDIVSPYMDDFTGYNEELGGFDIVLCVKELMEQLEAYKMEAEEGKEINAELKAENKHLNNLLNQALKELEEMRELKDTESLQAYILTRENERLKELLAQDQCFQNKSHKCVKSFYIDERYKQAIEKIKDIAQDFGFNGIYEDCFTGIQKILQICDEVNECENQ
jgi:DNA repair ATPase RecN